ncbi:MAG: hypothetical protein V4820_05120 [Pseudomonadota bacterium]
MQTLTEIVAAVVVSSSAAAYSHFGVTLDTQKVDQPVPVERTVARTMNKKYPTAVSSKVVVGTGKAGKLVRDDCPETRAKMLKA